MCVCVCVCVCVFTLPNYIFSDEKSGEKLSTEAVVFITIAITFVVTALITYLLTSMYYRLLMTHQVKKFKVKFEKLENVDQQLQESPQANLVEMDPTCVTTIQMEDIPADTEDSC